MPIYCDESGGVGRGVMTLAAISIAEEDATLVLQRFREITGLTSELKGSRIDLAERGLLFEILGHYDWRAAVTIAISALVPENGQDRGDHDTSIYARLLNETVATMTGGTGDCASVIIDDGRYGPETLAAIRRDMIDAISPCGTASWDISHRVAGLQIADVIANTFFNRAMVTQRQARMAAIVAPFLESGKIKLHLLSGDTEGDHQYGK
nr:DUF3800 domain-containing protein [uncultured Sphingorhabdus sp.]